MTTVTSNQIAFTDDGFQSFLENRNEPGWLTETRSAAWERFKELPWPSSKDEEWMRTDIRTFDLNKFHVPSPPLSSELPHAVLSEGVELAGSAATRDGGSVKTPTLDAKWVQQGVIFGNIADLLDEHGDLIQKYLFKNVDGKVDRFAALHQAVWTTGTFLHVPRNVVVDQPIHTLNTISDGGTDFCHTLVNMKDFIFLR